MGWEAVERVRVRRRWCWAEVVVVDAAGTTRVYSGSERAMRRFALGLIYDDGLVEVAPDEWVRRATLGAAGGTGPGTAPQGGGGAGWLTGRRPVVGERARRRRTRSPRRSTRPFRSPDPGA